MTISLLWGLCICTKRILGPFRNDLQRSCVLHGVRAELVLE